MEAPRLIPPHEGRREGGGEKGAQSLSGLNVDAHQPDLSYFGGRGSLHKRGNEAG